MGHEPAQLLRRGQSGFTAFMRKLLALVTNRPSGSIPWRSAKICSLCLSTRKSGDGTHDEANSRRQRQCRGTRCRPLMTRLLGRRRSVVSVSVCAPPGTRRRGAMEGRDSDKNIFKTRMEDHSLWWGHQRLCLSIVDERAHCFRWNSGVHFHHRVSNPRASVLVQGSPEGTRVPSIQLIVDYIVRR